MIAILTDSTCDIPGNQVELLNRKISEQEGSGKNLRITVLHGDAPAEASKLAGRIRAEYDPIELLINITARYWGLTPARAPWRCASTAITDSLFSG